MRVWLAPDGARRLDILALLRLQDLAARQAGVDGDGDDADGDHRVAQVRAEGGGDGDGEQQAGEGEQGVDARGG